MRTLSGLLIVLALAVSAGFAINVPGCTQITSSGPYTVTLNLVGANVTTVEGGFPGENACIDINASNVLLNCNGHSITNDGTTNSFGIYVASSPAISNVTVRNCPSVSGYYYSIMASDTSKSSFSNITTDDSTYMGFYLYYSDNNTFSNNTVKNNQGSYAIHFQESNNNTFENSTVRDNAVQGFGLWLSQNNTFRGNLAQNNTFNFFIQSSDGNKLYSNTVNTGFTGIIFYSSSGNTLVNNTSDNTTRSGFDIETGSSNNFLENNTADNNTFDGFALVFDADNNTLVNNRASGNMQGFILQECGNNSLVNNTASGNYYGIRLSISENNTFENNTVSDNDGIGFYVYEGNNNIFRGNIANNEAYYGFDLDPRCSGNLLENNIANNDSRDGFYLSSSPNNVLINNTASNNPYRGITIAWSSENNTIINGTIYNTTLGIGITYSDAIKISGTHLYGNVPYGDVEVDANSTTTFNLSDVIFDNPSGDMTNYSNISLNDALSPGDSYALSWSAKPWTPSFLQPVAQNFIAINPYSGAVYIDNLTWAWTNGDSAGMNESRFRIGEYTGIWEMLNATPDTASNTISMYGLNPESTFGLVEDNDLEAPTVSMSAPLNDSVFSLPTVEVNFTTTDDNSAVMNCAAYVDGSRNGAYSTFSNNTPSSITLGIPNGNHSLYVKCLDEAGNPGFSQTVNITMNLPPCPDPIVSPGTYLLNGSAFGAPNDASDFYSGAMACVQIASSDVVFDCNGSSITNDGTSDSIGIFVDGFSGELTNVIIRNCPRISDYNYGIYAYNTSGSNFTNLTSYDSGEGLELDYSANSDVLQNAFNGGGDGIYLYSSEGINILYNNFSNNYAGIYLDHSTGTNLSGDRLLNSTNPELNIYDSDQTMITDDYLSNNGYGLNAQEDEGNTITYNATGMIFDNPSGGMSDYTNLSISDAMSSETYSISWSGEPGALQPGARSFDSKYLAFSTSSGSPSIDSMTWGWQESEVTSGGYDESLLGLYGYAGSWSALNTSPDTFAHTLGLSDFAPSGIVGILEYSPPAACPAPIGLPGSYQLDNNTGGAPNDASDVGSGWSACVVINSSDVVFDCNGHTITNDGTSNALGIFVNGYSGPLTNVTIRNCPGIPGYNTGIYVYGASGSTFANITASGDTDGGFGLYSSSNNTIRNISASSNGYSGFSLADSDHNTFEYCIANNDWRAGFITYSSNNNTLENSSASNSSFDGFAIGDSSAGNTLRGNTAYNNANGIYLSFNHNNTLENNNASDNQQRGITLQSCDNTTLRNNTANRNQWYNFMIDSSNGSTLEYNTADYGSNIGFYLWASHGNNLTDNTAAENGWTDLFVAVSSDSDCNNLVSRMNGSGNRPINYTNETVDWENFKASEIELCNADNSVIRNATINGSDALDNNGLIFMNTDNSLVAGSDSYNNSVGFTIQSGTSNTFANNTAEGGYGGFYVEYGSGNNFINNTVANTGYGFDIDYIANNNVLANNTVYGSGTGLYLYDADANILSNEHYYGNTVDLDVVEDQGASLSYSAAGVIFDNPAGNMSDYTALSINDTFSNEEYQISWDSQPAALPENQTSFAQKFITITPITATPSLDSVAWSWTPAEVSSGGYDESNFSVWSYDSGIWANQTTGTLDTLSHTFTIAGLVPASTYGILQNGPAGPVSENVSVALENPANGHNATARAITFNCSANASSLSNITLYGNFSGTWQANQTNSVGGASNSTTFTLNLSYASYSWNCLAYDTDGNFAWAPANYTFTADSLPLDSNFGGSTTDFSSALDLQNVSTPVLENTAYGKLQWNNMGLNVAGADFNSYVLFGNGTVSVDSSHLSPTLNSPANITLYGLPYQYTPVLYADGVLCTTDCTILSYTSHNLAFTVPHFTNYSAGPNTNLTIYDQYEGSNASKLTPITFYANYTNATDGSHVAGATCTISFDDASSGTMVDTGSQYNYTKASGFATTGIHLWNVTCNESGYETLFAQDSITVGPLNLTGNMTSLYQATVNASVALPRFVYNASGSISNEGGNISGADVSTEVLTDRWAAFYGNITGSIMLTDKAGANNVYQWGWTPASGGVVCTSTNSSVTGLTLYPADGDDIDAAWSFAPTEADSGRNTFNQTGCSLTIGTTPITNASYADTGQAGGFITCSLKDTINAAKKDMYFCTNITQNGVFWNNQVGDFELMVPTAFGNNVYETYYFYVNLG